jgi:hypothetical protein
MLPFRWMVAFPVELLRSRLTLAAALTGLAVQARLACPEPVAAQGGLARGCGHTRRLAHEMSGDTAGPGSPRAGAWRPIIVLCYIRTIDHVPLLPLLFAPLIHRQADGDTDRNANRYAKSYVLQR